MEKEYSQFVPYQLCPKCNGTGVVPILTTETTTIDINQQCDVCLGAKIIPMYVLPQ